jgi:putative addiction module component (TIGR02574 family)
MARKVALPPPGFQDLSPEERLDYVQDLWDYLVASPEQVTVPKWHWTLLRERLAAYAAAPQESKSWSQFRQELLRALASRKPSQD